MCIYGCMRWVRYVPTIRLGFNASSGFEYFVFAKKMKLFRQCGLRVQLIEFGSFSDVQQAFEWGQIHGMVCNLVDVMVTIKKNKKHAPKIILIPSYPTPKAACHLLVDSSIKNLNDIKGKIVGVEIHSFGGFVLLKALKSVALSLNDVHVRFVDPTAFLTFLNKQKVQGVVSYPPYSANLIKSYEGLHSIYSTENWPKEMQLNVLVIDQNTLQKHTHGLKKFVSQWDNLLNLYNKDPSIAHNILSHHLSVSPQRANKIFNTVIPLKLEEQMLLFSANKYLSNIIETINTELLVNNNLTNEKINFDAIFDSTFLHEALRSKQ